jgi:hypothetical protein
MSRTWPMSRAISSQMVLAMELVAEVGEHA